MWVLFKRAISTTPRQCRSFCVRVPPSFQGCCTLLKYDQLLYRTTTKLVCLHRYNLHGMGPSMTLGGAALGQRALFVSGGLPYFAHVLQNAPVSCQIPARRGSLQYFLPFSNSAQLGTGEVLFPTPFVFSIHLEVEVVLSFCRDHPRLPAGCDLGFQDAMLWPCLAGLPPVQ